MVAPVAFRYRRRMGDKLLKSAHVGETIYFDERIDYIISFGHPLSPAELQRLLTLGGELIEADVGILSFGNFLGQAELAGVNIDVVSTKIGPGGVSKLLQEISAIASSLIFGWRAPAGFRASKDESHHAAVPYHQLQYLRQIMLAEHTGQRLQDWLGIIERNPTRRFEPERPVVSVDRVRRLDHRAIQSVFTRLERLVPVPAGVAIGNSRLASRLSIGSPPEKHFPRAVAAPRGRLSFDTPENRFVKHVIGECLALVYRFVDHPKLHEELKADCRMMLEILEEAAAAPFLAEAGRLTGFHAPTQALAKADGYRELFAFWGDLTAHVSLPTASAETSRLLEGRDIATLYEYWVFIKIVEAIVAIAESRPSGPPMVQRDELGETLSLGLTTAVGPNVTVCFNKTYKRSNSTAYSTPLRPDVTVRLGDAEYAFDAKYRLDRLDLAETDADEDVATYKRADLYKMHTYRDAIKDLKCAFIVYPGTEFVFFERAGSKQTEPSAISLADGVGAIPLRPTDTDPASNLRKVLEVLITVRGHAAVP
jgi:uncharacterized protein